MHPATMMVVEKKRLIEILSTLKNSIPCEVSRAIDNAGDSIPCEVLYDDLSSGPILIIFEIALNEAERNALVDKIAGIEAFAEIFTIDTLSVRLFRCKKESYHLLRDYVAVLE